MSAVDLSTCDREPIHIPGMIQPHGVLLAIDAAGALRMWSDNAAERLGVTLTRDAPLPGGEVAVAIARAIAGFEAGEEASAVTLSSGTYDVVTHASGDLTIVELEAREVDAPALEAFASRAQRAIARLRPTQHIEQLLDNAVNEVRALTGFDRVMAYRFQQDDSGVVVAETRRDDLEPFLGHRYPATDIPAQARRLYVLNPLRLIADVGYVPVVVRPAVNPLTGASLDMSHSVLRSVSPVHIEYLTNMKVGASMSISIVVGDRLWGLIACHHMTPRRAPHAVRMACNILAQVVSVLVARAEVSEEVALRDRAARVQAVVLQRLASGGDLLPDLVSGSPSILELVAADGAVVTLSGKVAAAGETPDEAAIHALLARLRGREFHGVFASYHLVHDAPDIAPLVPGFSGMLAAPFSREQDGYLIWLRREEIETVRWGGNPYKQYTVGPLGPRLTPRGSFEEWRETVRDQSRAWTTIDRDTAARLGSEMQQIALGQARARISALEQTNAELDRVTYVVSHDLRAPLRAISSLTEFIEEDLRAKQEEQAYGHLATLRARIVRLDDLIQAILRYSRAGHRRHEPVAVDTGLLVREAIELLAPPDDVTVTMTGAFPKLRTGFVPMQQVFLNLLSNALKYGTHDHGGQIDVSAHDRGSMWQFTVADQGGGVGPEHFERIFELFSRVSVDSGGTGIGLATVRRTVESYGGRAWVESVLGQGARFHFTWPKDVPA